MRSDHEAQDDMSEWAVRHRAWLDTLTDDHVEPLPDMPRTQRVLAGLIAAVAVLAVTLPLLDLIRTVSGAR